MDNNTSQLLQQLADKLGTTSQYLWGVMVRQAHISATVSLIEIIIVWVLCYVFYRVHRKFMGVVPSEDDYLTNTYYEEYDAALAVPMICIGILLLIFFIVSIFAVSNVVYGFMNPEYWALDQILSYLKSSQ